MEPTKVDPRQSGLPAKSGLPEAAWDISREQIGGVKNLWRRPIGTSPDGSDPPPNKGFLGGAGSTDEAD